MPGNNQTTESQVTSLIKSVRTFTYAVLCLAFVSVMNSVVVNWITSLVRSDEQRLAIISNTERWWRDTLSPSHVRRAIDTYKNFFDKRIADQRANGDVTQIMDIDTVNDASKIRKNKDLLDYLTIVHGAKKIESDDDLIEMANETRSDLINVLNMYEGIAVELNNARNTHAPYTKNLEKNYANSIYWRRECIKGLIRAFRAENKYNTAWSDLIDLFNYIDKQQPNTK